MKSAIIETAEYLETQAALLGPSEWAKPRKAAMRSLAQRLRTEATGKTEGVRAMSNDKHQALRDALKAPSFMRYVRPELVSALLADHDRMRAALRRTEFCWECGSHDAAIETLRECGR